MPWTSPRDVSLQSQLAALWSTGQRLTGATAHGVPSAVIHCCPWGLSRLLQTPSLSFWLHTHLFVGITLTPTALATPTLGATRGRRGKRAAPHSLPTCTAQVPTPGPLDKLEGGFSVGVSSQAGRDRDLPRALPQLGAAGHCETTHTEH